MYNHYGNYPCNYYPYNYYPYNYYPCKCCHPCKPKPTPTPTPTPTNTYTVLNPRSYRTEITRYPLSPRLTTLDGKTIFMTCPKQTGSYMEDIFKVLTERIKLKYPTAKVIFEYKPSEYFEDDPDFWKKMKDTSDAFFYGCAPSSSSTHWSVKWGCNLEKNGLPGVMTIYEGLLQPALTTREAQGVPIRIQPFKYPPSSMSQQELNQAADDAIQKLITPLTPEEKVSGVFPLPIPEKVVFTGSINEVNDFYVGKGWTDGLPIIPPTQEAVNEMLTGTHHKPDEIVTTTMWPESMTVTVEEVAINGVMAGCTKEYFPLLLAIVEAFGKGNNNSPIRSTNAFSWMQIVNGPIASELKMNGGVYALGPGNKSNAIIGRALRLFIINLGHGTPGLNMLSTQGNPSAYTFAFRESEKTPWETYAQTKGFGKNESVVTVMGGGWSHLGNYLSGDLKQLAHDVSVFEWPIFLTVLMSESAANKYAKLNMTQKDVAHYVWENCTVTAKQFRSLFYYTWFIEPILKRAEAEGKPAPWPVEYMYLPDDAIVHPFPQDNIYVAVVGGDANPMMQAWMMGTPSSVSIDKWK